jgi:hypothetical protein
MDLEAIAAAAVELGERLTAMATMQALPGDSAMHWHDHREEALGLVELVTAGLHLMAVPA